MFALIDSFLASQREHALAQEWADFAFRHFGEEAAERLQASLKGTVTVKSRRALRMALRRARANVKTRIFVASSR